MKTRMKNKVFPFLTALVLSIGVFSITALANAGGDTDENIIILSSTDDESTEAYENGKSEDVTENAISVVSVTNVTDTTNDTDGTDESEDSEEADLLNSITMTIAEDGTTTYSFGGWTWTLGTGDMEAETGDSEESQKDSDDGKADEMTSDETDEEENYDLIGTVVNINSYLNLRSGAGTDYKVIGKLTNGTEVEVIGEENGWYKVVVPEMTGYVYSGYLDVLEKAVENDDDDADVDLDNLDETFLLTLLNLLMQGGDTDEDTSLTALTPDGNLTLVDDIDTQPNSDTGKQFITVTTRSGNYFYLIIDRDDEGEETVHFLNQVDEADLLTLMDDEDVAEYEASLSTVETEVETEKATEPVTESAMEATEEESGNNLVGIFLILLLVVVLAGGGGFFAYTRLQSKKAAEEKPDPDADYDDDEGYDYSGELSDDGDDAGGDEGGFED